MTELDGATAQHSKTTAPASDPIRDTIRQYDIRHLLAAGHEAVLLAARIDPSGARVRLLVNVLEVRGDPETHARIERVLEWIRQAEWTPQKLRIYPVADLGLALNEFVPQQITQTGPDDDTRSPPFATSDAERPREEVTLATLARTIRETVEGDCEGLCQIRVHSSSLVVWGPPAMHDEIADYLSELRFPLALRRWTDPRFRVLHTAVHDRAEQPSLAR